MINYNVEVQVKGLTVKGKYGINADELANVVRGLTLWAQAQRIHSFAICITGSLLKGLFNGETASWQQAA